jgi:hypothetical protein
MIVVFSRLLLPAALALLVSLGAAHAQPAAPDTPAGQVLRAWLDAFDSGDAARIRAFLATDDPSQATLRAVAISVDGPNGLMNFRDRTGGFGLQSVVSDGPLHLRFVVKEAHSATLALGDLVVKPGSPPTVDRFRLTGLPAGAVLAPAQLDAATRRQAIDGVLSLLARFYYDADVARRMSEAVHANQAAGAYEAITDGGQLAGRLTDDLRAQSHDLHLTIVFTPFKASLEQEPLPQNDARMASQLLAGNCAFDKAEILPGNIGYLKFDVFEPVDLCGPTAAAAMAFIGHTDALIIDLRDNRGGDPPMIAFLASYFFDAPTHLNDFSSLHGGRFAGPGLTQVWTLPYLPGPRMAEQPVFILTSHATFSGAEEFSYDLQALKRATVVGAPTGGGAHPADAHLVADYFTVFIPYGEAINPITRRNWEGVGVKPDVNTAGADALGAAQSLALAAIHAAKR